MIAVVFFVGAAAIGLLVWFLMRRKKSSQPAPVAKKMGIMDFREFDELHPEPKSLLDFWSTGIAGHASQRVSGAYRRLTKEEQDRFRRNAVDEWKALERFVTKRLEDSAKRLEAAVESALESELKTSGKKI